MPHHMRNLPPHEKLPNPIPVMLLPRFVKRFRQLRSLVRVSKSSEEKKDRKKAHDTRLLTHPHKCKRRSNRPPNLKANIHCKLTRAL